MDVRVGEVVTELVVTEGVGPLAPEEVKRIVALVLEQVRLERERSAQLKRDTAIRDRAFEADM